MLQQYCNKKQYYNKFNENFKNGPHFLKNLLKTRIIAKYDYKDVF